MAGRPPWAPGGFFGAGGLFGGRSDFADPFARLDEIMENFGSFGRPPEHRAQQRAAPRHASSTAREIPIEGPGDDEGPGQQPRFTGPVVHELPDEEEHPQLHASLLLQHTVAGPDAVWEPEEEPRQAATAGSSHRHHRHHGQELQQAAGKPDPLAAMGTGPPPPLPPRPTMPPPQPPPAPPPQTVRMGVHARGASAAPAAAAAADEEEPGSPMLVDLTDSLGFGASSPRHIQLPPAPEQRWAAGGTYAVPPPPPVPQHRQQAQRQLPPDWLTGDSCQTSGPAMPLQPQPPPPQRPSVGSPPDAGLFVRTPTAQPSAAAGGDPFLQPAGSGTSAAAAPARPSPPPQPQPSIFRSEVAAGLAEHESAALPGRRQRRPSSRLPAMQEAQAAAAAQAEEEFRRRRSRQQRQARSRRSDELYGSGEEEGAELLPEEDPDWAPGGRGRHSHRAATPPSAAGVPPLPKRSRRSGSAPG